MIVNTVVSDSKDLTKCGALAKNLSQAAGDRFVTEFSKKGGLRAGNTRHQHPGNLDCKLVMHMSIQKWKKGNREVRN